MSEKPRETQGDRQEDFGAQVITQGLEKITGPAQTADMEEATPKAALSAAKPKNGNRTASAGDRKSRQSAVYLYLLILFGAALLMLLLAYFVQQRGNENTVSDPRNSTSLSREGALNDDHIIPIPTQWWREPQQRGNVSRETER